MKIVLTGSLGHIGMPLTKQLVAKGHAVTVISSNPEKQKDIEALGASAAIGSIEDVKFLTSAFKGADAVYTMLPPPNFFVPGFDVMKHCREIAANFSEAIRSSGVKRVVHLSSIGAHLRAGTGLILTHRMLEDALTELKDIAITFMRPTAFYYNLLRFAGAVKNSGMIASNYGGEDIVAWVYPGDIADAVADELVTPLADPSVRKVRYVASDELRCSEVASILGEAIGMPDLKWIVISDEQMQSGMEAFGMPTAIAAGLVEMQSNMHSGPFFDDYYANRPVMGKVKLTEFAAEFAEAYKNA